MKVFTQLFPLLLILLLTRSLQAQNIEVVTPSNAAASAEEIKAAFRHLITVGVDEIEDFYMDTWIDEPFDSLCKHPDANVVHMDNTVAQFEWTLPAGGTIATVIHSLRLSDGLIQSTNSSTGAATVNRQNDLYLFIFQSECNGQRSAADIVIIDKPVLLHGAPCDCKEYKDIWSEDFPPQPGADVGDNEITDFPWDSGDDSDFYCRVDFDEGTVSSLRFHITYQNGIPWKLGTYEECLNNVVAQFGGTFLGAVNSEQTTSLGTFLFATNNSLTFQPIGDLTGTIHLRKCKDKPKPVKIKLDENQTKPIESDILFTSLKNPFIDHTTIQYSLPTNQNISIQLYNALGQTIKQIKAPALTKKGIHKMDIDLSNFATGMYFCILKTDSQNLSIKLQKTN